MVLQGRGSRPAKNLKSHLTSGRERGKPQNPGGYWWRQGVSQVYDERQQGMDFHDYQVHDRTGGGIAARLIKPGKIKPSRAA